MRWRSLSELLPVKNSVTVQVSCAIRNLLLIPEVAAFRRKSPEIAVFCRKSQILTTSLLFLELVSITFEIFDAFALFSISLLLSLLAHFLFIPGLITVIHYIMVFQFIKSPPSYSKLTCYCRRCSTQVFWCQPDSEITSLAQGTRSHRIQCYLGHI